MRKQRHQLCFFFFSARSGNLHNTEPRVPSGVVHFCRTPAQNTTADRENYTCIVTTLRCIRNTPRYSNSPPHLDPRPLSLQLQHTCVLQGHTEAQRKYFSIHSTEIMNLNNCTMLFVRVSWMHDGQREWIELESTVLTCTTQNSASQTISNTSTQVHACLCLITLEEGIVKLLKIHLKKKGNKGVNEYIDTKRMCHS